MCNSGRMPDFGRKTRLRSYARLQLEDMTAVVYPDSTHTSQRRLTSWLQSYLLIPIAHDGSARWVCRMSYHLSCERLHMVGLDDYSILQPGHLVWSRLGGMHDSFSVQNLIIARLHMFKTQAMCRVTDKHLARLDLRETRNPSIQKDSVPPIT
jgi:hypothetical protein